MFLFHFHFLSLFFHWKKLRERGLSRLFSLVSFIWIPREEGRLTYEAISQKKEHLLTRPRVTYKLFRRFRIMKGYLKEKNIVNNISIPSYPSIHDTECITYCEKVISTLLKFDNHLCMFFLLFLFLFLFLFQGFVY